MKFIMKMCIDKEPDSIDVTTISDPYRLRYCCYCGGYRLEYRENDE